MTAPMPDETRALMEANWQPIATAPRDGTWMLLTGGSIEYRWDGETQPPMVVGQWAGDPSGGQPDGFWQFAWYDGGYLGEYEKPTHWASLPPGRPGLASTKGADNAR